MSGLCHRPAILYMQLVYRVQEYYLSRKLAIERSTKIPAQTTSSSHCCRDVIFFFEPHPHTAKPPGPAQPSARHAPPEPLPIPSSGDHPLDQTSERPKAAVPRHAASQ